MSTLVSDIINQAFGDLGLLQFAAAVTTDPQTAAFAIINEMWSAWGADPTITNAQYHQSLTVTAGTASYTFGTGGSLVATAAPLKIYGAKSESGTFSQPVHVVSFEEFDRDTASKTGSRATLASMLAADNSYPTMNIKVFPVPAPSPGSLILDYFGAMTAFAAVGTDISALSPAFLEALHFNLAMALLPRYGREYTDKTALAANASASLARIQNLNRSIMMPEPQQAGQ